MANKIYINAYKMLNESFGESDYSIKDLTTRGIILKLLSYMKGTFNVVEFTIIDNDLMVEPDVFDCMTRTVYTFAMSDPYKMFQRDCAKQMIEKTIYTFALANVESTLHRDSIKAMLERLSDTFNVNSLEINLDNVYLEHDDTSGFKNRVYLHISLTIPGEKLQEE